MLVRANYQLLIDNLLDLSHTCYLHAGVLGNADTVGAEIKVEQDGDDVLVGRHSHNAAPPGILSPFWPGHPLKVDVFNRVRWMAPSALKLISGLTAPGAAWESGTGLHAIHMLTPETQTTTHYFFTAVRWNIRTQDAALNRQMQSKIAELRRYAFEAEDAPIIEAQQRRIAVASRTLEPMILPIDAGPMRYKRVLAKMIEAEQT
jgi:vanillate O-demethylase monooxygenase subunit